MKQRRRFFLVLLLAALLISNSFILAQESSVSQVKSLRIQLLSTMLAEDGIGEWGFSALVEGDGHQILNFQN